MIVILVDERAIKEELNDRMGERDSGSITNNLFLGVKVD